jgi:hypothetical protein
MLLWTYHDVQHVCYCTNERGCSCASGTSSQANQAGVSTVIGLASFARVTNMAPSTRAFVRVIPVPSATGCVVLGMLWYYATAGNESSLEAETSKHARANTKESGPNRMTSPLLDDAKLPSVLSARKIVRTHASIVMRREGQAPAGSPARRRMTMADSPNMTAAPGQCSWQDAERQEQLKADRDQESGCGNISCDPRD